MARDVATIDFPASSSLIATLRDRAVILVMCGYLLFNWGFMQLRVPPGGGGGVPLGEIVLILSLATLHYGALLNRLSNTVLIVPFVLWWGYGVVRVLQGFNEHGMWALRDGVQVVESLYLLLGFAYMAQPEKFARFRQWFKWVIVIGVIYAMFYRFPDVIRAISPRITTANNVDISIIGNFTNTTVLLWLGAFYLLLFKSNRPWAIVLALVLLAYNLFMFQGRTLYLHFIFLFLFLSIFRSSLAGSAVIGAVGVLAVAALLPILGIELTGRLGAQVSLEFMFNHFMAIFGVAGSEEVAGAASGVDQRFEWWIKIWQDLTAGPVSLLTGLGYGVPLTDFGNVSGVIVREPHNSFISVFARGGLLGGVFWVWMHLLLLARWLGAMRMCADLGWNEARNWLLLIMVYFICIWTICLSQDGLEKPFNIIPYYFLWGVVLRLYHQLANGLIGPDAETEAYAETR